MTKNEIKKAIENAAAIAKGEYALNFELTAAVYGGKIPYAATEKDFADVDFEDTYEDENGEEITKTAVVIAKDENGEVKVIVDNGECYPATYTADEFAGVYGDDAKGDTAAVTFDELKSAFVDFAEEKTPEFAAQLIDEYFPNAENREKLIEELLVG